MSRTYLRGEIYYADLDPVVGSEQMGTRPVLILQNNVGNHFARTVIVAPITSRIHTKSKIPTQLHRHDRQNEISLGGHAGAAAHPG